MPQIQLPIFPVGSCRINEHLAVDRRGDQVTYFYGHLPVFTHEAADLQSFRMFTTQLVVNGSATQSQIIEAFGLSPTTVKRCVKRFRKGGVKAMFAPAARRKGTKLAPEPLEKAQQMLDSGMSVPAISKALGILPTTLHKAIDQGRLRNLKKKALILAFKSAAQPSPNEVSATKQRPWAWPPTGLTNVYWPRWGS